MAEVNVLFARKTALDPLAFDSHRAAGTRKSGHQRARAGGLRRGGCQCARDRRRNPGLKGSAPDRGFNRSEPSTGGGDHGDWPSVFLAAENKVIIEIKSKALSHPIPSDRTAIFPRIHHRNNPSLPPSYPPISRTPTPPTTKPNSAAPRFRYPRPTP